MKDPTNTQRLFDRQKPRHGHTFLILSLGLADPRIRASRVALYCRVPTAHGPTRLNREVYEPFTSIPDVEVRAGDVFISLVLSGIGVLMYLYAGPNERLSR